MSSVFVFVFVVRPTYRLCVFFLLIIYHVGVLCACDLLILFLCGLVSICQSSCLLSSRFYFEEDDLRLNVVRHLILVLAYICRRGPSVYRSFLHRHPTDSGHQQFCNRLILILFDNFKITFEIFKNGPYCWQKKFFPNSISGNRIQLFS